MMLLPMSWGTRLVFRMVVSGDGLGESYSERVSARGGLVRVLAGGGVLLGSAALLSPSSSACRSPSLAGLPGASGSAPEALCRGLSAAGPRGASVSALVSARRRGRSAGGVPGGAEPVASSSMPDGLDGGELSDFSSSDSGEDGTGWESRSGPGGRISAALVLRGFGLRSGFRAERGP